MINIGEFNALKVIRKADFGYYLDAGTGNTSDDILLPNKSALEKEISIGDEVNAFIYRDSKDRIIATLKEPIAKVGEIAYLKVVSKTKIGSFIDFGMERDIFVPMKEQVYSLEIGSYYLFYIYLDKTNRIAATTDIDRYLENLNVEETDEILNCKYRVGDEVTGIIYGFQTNRSVMIAVDKKYRGVILKNEYFIDLKEGYELKLRVKKIYEDGKIGLTPRKRAEDERTELQESIIQYLKKNNGSMPFNDKSSPEDIRKVFHESKNYFKNALGGLMKQGIVEQDENGTRLK
ncbi:CvfB family protein [Clostridium drakei]|uniref:DNA-binding protein n=1 Tax=Clostridium drakei TaxID=332101 RepID=A0A2U8DLB2_9CLOT|nr:S1-like domain-containing RNA-binding protein [Clostridium drakei]AWI03221.1 DNA-binding protein [Clostridium drakei]